MSEQEPIKGVSKPGETKVLITSTLVRGVDIYQFPSVQWQYSADAALLVFARNFMIQPITFATTMRF